MLAVAFYARHDHHEDVARIEDTLVLTGWVMVEPAEDIPGLWVAHCLDLDVISQGDSPSEAVESVREAMEMTVLDDLNSGLNPSERGRAPEEFWARLAHVLKHGSEVKIADVSGPALLAIQMTLVFERVRHDHRDDYNSTMFVPPATARVDQPCAA
jgi:predicted RNase H-like HicB family nuclease